MGRETVKERRGAAAGVAAGTVEIGKAEEAMTITRKGIVQKRNEDLGRKTSIEMAAGEASQRVH